MPIEYSEDEIRSFATEIYELAHNDLSNENPNIIENARSWCESYKNPNLANQVMDYIIRNDKKLHNQLFDHYKALDEYNNKKSAENVNPIESQNSATETSNAVFDKSELLKVYQRASAYVKKYAEEEPGEHQERIEKATKKLEGYQPNTGFGLGVAHDFICNSLIDIYQKETMYEAYEVEQLGASEQAIRATSTKNIILSEKLSMAQLYLQTLYKSPADFKRTVEEMGLLETDWKTQFKQYMSANTEHICDVFKNNPTISKRFSKYKAKHAEYERDAASFATTSNETQKPIANVNFKGVEGVKNARNFANHESSDDGILAGSYYDGFKIDNEENCFYKEMIIASPGDKVPTLKKAVLMDIKFDKNVKPVDVLSNINKYTDENEQWKKLSNKGYNLMALPVHNSNGELSDIAVVCLNYKELKATQYAAAEQDRVATGNAVVMSSNPKITHRKLY